MIHIVVGLLVLEMLADLALHRYIGDSKPIWYALALLAYAAVVWLLTQGMRLRAFTQMNTLWQASNIACVGVLGILVFKERMSRYQYAGLGLAVLSASLMCIS